MKLKNWLFISGAAFIIGSCGESSTNPSDKDTTSTSNTTTTTTTDNSTPNPGNTNAGTTNVEVVPAAKTNFESKYPSASNVSWTYYEPYSDIDWTWTGWPALDTKDYTVRYNMDGSDYYTWYDQDGNWIGTTTVVSNSNLPAPVNNAIKREFKDYTITSVNKENDKNREAYEVKLEKGSDKMTALITSEGTVFKKKGTMKGEKVKEKVDVK
jgi:Putative beta-lactamase-inhibitor-like, PepSY-like